MTQSDFGTINPTTKTGTALATDLNNFRDALHTSHKDSTPPSYVVAGMFWLDDAASPLLKYKFYDGTDHITVFEIDINNNNFILQSMKDGTALTHGASIKQIQNSSFTYLGTSSGTNTITATATPTVTALVAGQFFMFKVGGTNTGAVTFAADATGAKAVQIRGAALKGGEFTANNMAMVMYDGTQYQMVSPSTALVLNKFDATTAPTANDDVGDGYSVGSRWIDVTNDERYICVDATSTAAIWLKAAALNATQTFTKTQYGVVTELTDGATITPDFSLGHNYKVQVAGNRTLGNPSNLIAGVAMSFEMDIYQDATGSRTLAIDWGYNTPAAGGITLTTAGGSKDTLYGDVKVYEQSTVTITIASPGVITWAGHGLFTGQKIQLTTTGTLPTGLVADTTYFVIEATTDTLKLATTLVNAAAGTAINTSATQSGTHTMTALSIDINLQSAWA